MSIIANGFQSSLEAGANFYIPGKGFGSAIIESTEVHLFFEFSGDFVDNRRQSDFGTTPGVLYRQGDHWYVIRCTRNNELRFVGYHLERRPSIIESLLDRLHLPSAQSRLRRFLESRLNSYVTVAEYSSDKLRRMKMAEDFYSVSERERS
jgi:hypothetical protein